MRHCIQRSNTVQGDILFCVGWCLLLVGLGWVGSGQARNLPAGWIMTAAGDTVQGYGGENLPAARDLDGVPKGENVRVGALYSPTGLAVSSDNQYLYIAEMSSHRVRRMDLVRGTIQTFAGDGNAGDEIRIDTLATNISIQGPMGVTLDRQDNVYIADTGNHRVLKVDRDGFITKIAGSSQEYGFSGDDGAASAARLNTPRDVAVDENGHIYIADYRNYRVRRVDAVTGVITTIAGSGKKRFEESAQGLLDPTATGMYPTGLALDSRGDLLIADKFNHRVMKLDLQAGTLSVVAGTGKTGHRGDGRKATQALLSSPHTVAVSPNGNIYICDTENKVIRKIDERGYIETVAGLPNKKTNVGKEGKALQISFESPYGISVDAFENIYVSDMYDHKVRRINTNSAPRLKYIPPPKPRGKLFYFFLGTAGLAAGGSGAYLWFGRPESEPNLPAPENFPDVGANKITLDQGTGY